MSAVASVVDSLRNVIAHLESTVVAATEAMQEQRTAAASDTVRIAIVDTLHVHASPAAAEHTLRNILVGATIGFVAALGAQWYRLFLEHRARRLAVVELLFADLEALGKLLDQLSQQWEAARSISMQQLAQVDFIATNYQGYKQDIALCGAKLSHRVHTLFREMSGIRETIRLMEQRADQLKAGIGAGVPPEETTSVYATLPGLKSWCDAAYEAVGEEWWRLIRLGFWWDLWKMRWSGRTRRMARLFRRPKLEPPGDEMNNDELGRELREKAKKIRPHASFFDWPVKQTKELGIVRLLVESVGGPLTLRAVRPGPDAPDAIGEREDGESVAIEVTELVDEEVTGHNVRSVREGRPEDTVYREWDSAGLIAAIEERLAAKDGVTLKAGPYGEYVVVLHTDEMTLSHNEVEGWLRGHVFKGLRRMTSAYLLFSYDPVSQGYPHIRLSISA